MTDAAPDSGVQHAVPPPALSVEQVQAIADRAAINAIVEAGGEQLRVPPTAAWAEDVVIETVLAGHATHADLPGLEPKHFSRPLHAAVFELAEHTLSRPALAMALWDRGFVGDVENQLEVLEYLTPVVPLVHLQQHAARIVETWKRRRLIEALRRADCLLCLDELTFDGAVQLLRERIRNEILEVRG